MKRFAILLPAVFIAAYLMTAQAEAMGADIPGQPSAKETKKAAVEPVAAAAPHKELTKQETLDRIKENLGNFEEILNYIPGLKQEVDSAKKAVYTYQGVRLDNLDKDSLDKLFGRVRNEAVRIRTERVNRQLESIRRIEQMNRQSNAMRTPSVPRPIPSVPKTPSTQSIPRIPKTPSSQKP